MTHDTRQTKHFEIGPAVLGRVVLVLLLLAVPGAAFGTKFARQLRRALLVSGDTTVNFVGGLLSRRFNSHTDLAVFRCRKRWKGPRVRIGLLSDPHIKRGRTAIERNALRQIAGRDLDIVLLAGDYGEPRLPWHVNRDRIEGFGAELGRAVGPHVPIVAVLGNHDYFVDMKHHDRGLVRRSLETAGITVLANEHRTFALAGGRDITIVGVDDGYTQQADVAESIRGLEDASKAVALTHHPQIAKRIAERGIPFIFAGHTHGGKLHIPVITSAAQWVVGEGRYVKGWYSVVSNNKGVSQLYVTSGLGDDLEKGDWRLGRGAKHEIAIIELHDE